MKPNVKTHGLFLVEICVSVLSLLSCTYNDRGNTWASIEINRLDLELREGKLPSDSSMRYAASVLFGLSGYGELTDSSVAVYAKSPAIALHGHAVDSVWRDMSELQNAVGTVKANFADLFPDRRFPGIYAVVSPFNQSVFTLDSILFVGLNHYLGVDYVPYSYFPDYIRKRKIPLRVAPDIAEALVRREFPYSPRSQYPTVLSRLLYEGAVVEAVIRLTGLDEHAVLAYDGQQAEWLEDNEHEIWNAIVGRKYLFSSDSQLAAMLVNISPVTTVIHTDCPGYAGRYIGHRIVLSYLSNNDVSLEVLLSPAFYEGDNTLSLSRYH